MQGTTCQRRFDGGRLKEDVVAALSRRELLLEWPWGERAARAECKRQPESRRLRERECCICIVAQEAALGVALRGGKQGKLNEKGRPPRVLSCRKP